MSLLLTLLFTIVSYNCENLFDCRHDSLKNDYEFLPPASAKANASASANENDNDNDNDNAGRRMKDDGRRVKDENLNVNLGASRNWNFGRYWKKLNNIGRVIQQCGSATSPGTLPDIVALLEVENDSTLFMLTRRSLLKGAGYKYVMTNSLDARGIDVAMIYNPLTFRLESSYSIRPELKRSKSDTEGIRTRDILYAKGVMRARDTLHIFVVHAPSRRNGKSATEGYRLQVEQRMMQSVDSIRNINPNAKIVLMGDFNDYSNDRALKDIVSRGFVETSKGIRGLNYEKTGVSGTYKYQGAWNSLDHIFLSTGVQQQVERCFIYDAAWLLEEDNQGGYKPFRTYLGPKYHDGVSDHLPIVLELKLE
jgi:endonuclease/exonuclease/phosphatase family metal-dependent hydrolase